MMAFPHPSFLWQPSPSPAASAPAQDGHKSLDDSSELPGSRALPLRKTAHRRLRAGPVTRSDYENLGLNTLYLKSPNRYYSELTFNAPARNLCLQLEICLARPPSASLVTLTGSKLRARSCSSFSNSISSTAPIKKSRALAVIGTLNAASLHIELTSHPASSSPLLDPQSASSASKESFPLAGQPQERTYIRRTDPSLVPVRPPTSGFVAAVNLFWSRFPRAP